MNVRYIFFGSARRQCRTADILLSHRLYHQHNSAFSFNKNVGVATHDGINLIGGDGLSIFTDMQVVTIDKLCYLLRTHPSILARKAI